MVYTGTAREGGSMKRSIGDDVDAQGISAAYDNGVLSVVIPIAERAKPRKIQIDSVGSRGSKVVTARPPP